jgi:hypothetical protein
MRPFEFAQANLGHVLKNLSHNKINLLNRVTNKT